MTSVALASPSAASALWFLSRGTGVVTLGLLTVVMVLGVLTRGGHPLPGAPRFVTVGLHRNASVLALSLLAVHIVTAVADPYAPIRLVDAVVPFVSRYRPVWLGLGALAFDLIVAVIATSLIRLRIGPRLFRQVHWASYGVWPVALVHGLGTGTDVRAGWMLLLTFASVAVVLTAVLYRLTRLSTSAAGRRLAGAAGATVTVVAVGGWLVVGPLAPHWAARAGTPQSLIGSAGAAGAASAASTNPGTVVAGAVQGSVRENVGSSATTIVFAGRVAGAHPEEMRIVLRGAPSGGGGVSLSSGTVTMSPAGGATYAGPVTGLNGGAVSARLAGPAGVVNVVVDVRGDLSAGSFQGTVRVL